MSSPEIDRAVYNTYAKLQLMVVRDLDRIDPPTIPDLLESLSKELTRWSDVSINTNAAETNRNVSRKWLARRILACRYAAGYQSQNGNREEDAARGLEALCLPEINVCYPQPEGGQSIAQRLINRPRVLNQAIALAQSTATAINIHLYLMPMEARPPQVREYSVLGYASHIINFLVEAVVYANNAAFTVMILNSQAQAEDLPRWRPFTPAIVIAILAVKDLECELAKSGYAVPAQHPWLGPLYNMYVVWEHYAQRYSAQRLTDPRLIVGQLIPDCFEIQGVQRRIRAEVYAMYMGAMHQAGVRWTQSMNLAQG